jgi:ligand-binding sensor domain-containing protein
LKVFISIFLILFSASVFAQEPLAISINKNNGMPSNEVYDVLQDAKGFMWLATEMGLVSYDGNAFKTYFNESQTSVAGSNLWIDNFNRIWYENFDGYLYFLQNDSLKSLQQNSTITYKPFGNSHDFLFVIQKNGIDVFDIKTLELKKTIFIETNKIKTSFSDGKAFYIITNNEIIKICNLPISRTGCKYTNVGIILEHFLGNGNKLC